MSIGVLCGGGLTPLRYPVLPSSALPPFALGSELVTFICSQTPLITASCTCFRASPNCSTVTNCGGIYSLGTYTQGQISLLLIMGVNLPFYPHHLPTMNTSQPLTYFDLVFATCQLIVGALIIIPITNQIRKNKFKKHT